MRTDPRADEVRGIVERVFSAYLRPGPQRRNFPAAAVGHRRPTDRFPRLFQPGEEESPWPGELSIDETILIDRGRYVARSYRTQEYLAMWLVDVGLLQFYDGRGRMLDHQSLPVAASAENGGLKSEGTSYCCGNKVERNM